MLIFCLHKLVNSKIYLVWHYFHITLQIAFENLLKYADELMLDQDMNGKLVYLKDYYKHAPLSR